MMFGSGVPATYGPEYRPELLGQGMAVDGPTYGPEYRPTELWLSANKWWLIGGGVGLFLLAGGSLLGFSMRKRRRGRR